MSALTQGRNTPRRDGDLLSLAVAAATKIFQGSIVMRAASGYATKGATAVALVGVGRAEEEADNLSGADGDTLVRVRPGIFRFDNSAAADEITIADLGKVAFAVDDQTVAKTDGGASRSPAGFIHDLDANGGVWVEFDETKLRAYLG